MTPAAVGLRCPDHAGNPRLARTVQRRGIQRAPQRLRGTEALVTKALIAVNVAIYLITAVQGNGINAPGGTLFAKMFLFGPAVAQGDWWRLITAAGTRSTGGSGRAASQASSRSPSQVSWSRT